MRRPGSGLGASSGLSEHLVGTVSRILSGAAMAAVSGVADTAGA